MKQIVGYIFLCFFSGQLIAQKEITFSCLDSVYAYADKKSAVIRNNQQQVLLAKYQKIAALANVVNLKDPITFSLTDNTTLPVSFIPGNIFGGKPGSFEKVTMGQQYVSNFNITPQIDLINPGNWAQIKSARINEDLTAVTNLLNKKSLHESIAACYFNICSFNDQILITKKNLEATDSILQVVTDKFNQGIVRKQDVNDAQINKLSLQDKLNQLLYSLVQQNNSLKILCDIPLETNLSISEPLLYNQSFSADLPASSQLQVKANMLQMEYAKADLRSNRLSNLPVLSLLYSNSYYQNSVNHFFDTNPNNKWLTSAYFGAKMTINIPDVNHLLSSRNAKINYQISQINFEHGKLQNDLSNDQLRVDYQKAYSQYLLNKQINLLKEENYKMATNQYNQEILSFDKLLLAYTDMLSSRFNYSSSLANLLFTKTKVDINNTIK